MYELLAPPTVLTDEQREIIATVRAFVDKEIIPNVSALERSDTYPADIVDGLKELGLFGLTIPEEYGGLGESLLVYALCVEQLARGWMSVSGVVNTHFIVAHLLLRNGTAEQKRSLLPRMVTGETRGAFSMSEPGVGSDVAALRTRARRTDDDSYVLDGEKMWLTNGGSSTLVAVLVRTERGTAGSRPHAGLTTFLIEKPTGNGEVLDGLSISDKIDKMGYKGVDTTAMAFNDFRLPATAILGGVPAEGFYQMMDAVEVGRVNVAARACGLSARALELAIDYSRQREAFGKHLYEHQAISFKIADMASRLAASRALMIEAAHEKEAGASSSVGASIAKLVASESCMQITQDSFRIHGGYGYSKEFEIERLMRDAPFLLVGEGTSEIQKVIISKAVMSQR